MSEFDALNWDLYPKYDEIVTDPEVSTSIFAFESEIAEPVYEKTIQFLKTKGYHVNEELIESVIKRSSIFLQNKQVGLLEPAYSWLILRTNSELDQLIRDFIYENYEDEIRSAGNVRHEEDEKKLKKNAYRVKFRSGVHESHDNLTPYTFFELHRKNELLAKAILEYYNGEMSEFEPTILLIEVREDIQQKGIGSYLLRFIECQLSRWGFYTIWSSDTKNMGFWEKMGYEIDIDEGVKGIDPLDCDEDM